MKKQVKEQLEKMVKGFNEYLERKNFDYSYRVSSHSYARGKYAVEITFNSLFNSLDFCELMDVVRTNNLTMFMGHHEWGTDIYIQ